MGWMMFILAAQTGMVIAVVIWLHRIRRRADALARDLAGTQKALDEAVLSLADSVETAGIAEHRLADAIRTQNRLGVRLFRWRKHFERIAAQETPTANATVRRMARMARELPTGPGRR